MKTMQLVLTVIAAMIGGGIVQWLSQGDVVQAQEATDTLRAKKIELIAENGDVRARWKATDDATEMLMIGPDQKTNISMRIKKDGTSVITFYDAKKHSRVVLGATGDGWSGIGFADKEGRQRSSIGNDKTGAPTLSMMYANGKMANLLTVQGEKDSVLILNDPKGENIAAFGNSNGQPNLLLIDKAGHERLKLLLKKDNSPALMLRDEKGRGRIVAGVNPNGWAGVGLMDENDNERCLLFSERSGKNGIAITDSKGNSRSAMVVTENDEPVIELLDEKGNQLFKAPR